MNTQTTSRAFALLLACGAALVGTACHSPAPSPGQPDPYPAPENNPQIAVLDPNLQRGIGIQAAVVIPAGEGPMIVQVPVRNLTNFEYLVDYRVLFYDERGLEIQPTMSWKMVSLLPKQTANFSANGLDNTARNWRMEIKWAR